MSKYYGLDVKLGLLRRKVQTWELTRQKEEHDSRPREIKDSCSDYSHFYNGWEVGHGRETPKTTVLRSQGVTLSVPSSRKSGGTKASHKAKWETSTSLLDSTNPETPVKNKMVKIVSTEDEKVFIQSGYPSESNPQNFVMVTDSLSVQTIQQCLILFYEVRSLFVKTYRIITFNRPE